MPNVNLQDPVLAQMWNEIRALRSELNLLRGGEYIAESGTTQAIQGYAVQDHAPENGEGLFYVAANNQYEPSAPEARVIASGKTTLTIASGEITVTKSFHQIETEGGAGTDYLDTINGGVDGMILVLMSYSSIHDVILRDSVGNIQIAGDFTLSTRAKTITLIRSTISDEWFELSRSDN